MRRFVIAFTVILALVMAFAPSLAANEDLWVPIPYFGDAHGPAHWDWTRNFAQGFFDQEVIFVSPVSPQRDGTWFISAFHAVLEDNTLWGWGDNNHARLGDGTTISRSTPVMILDSVLSFSVQTALRADGSMWTWGFNPHGHVGDGTTDIRMNPFRVMDDVATIGHVFSYFMGWTVTGSIALRTDGSLWAWGRRYATVDIPHVESTRLFESLTPIMIASNFALQQQWGIQTFTADDGQEWTINFIPPVRPAEPEPPAPGEYIHAPTPPGYLFSPPRDNLANVATPESAIIEVTRMAQTLTPEQRTSGDALNIAALYIENVTRRGTTQNAPAGGNLSADILNENISTASQIHQDTQNILTGEGVALQRNLRTNLNFISDTQYAISMNFPDSVSNIAFDNVSIESDFAMVTLNRAHIAPGGEISVRLPYQPATEAMPNSVNIAPGNHDSVPASGNASNGNRILNFITSFWSVVAVAVILVAWFILSRMDIKLRLWVAPTFAVLAIAVNLGLFFFIGNNENDEPANVMAESTPAPQSEATPVHQDNTIIVEMTEGMRATLSLPANGANPETLILFNEHGEIQHTKYNPATGNIDANIRASGTYILQEHTVSFADISHKSQMMQDAIIRLASRGIMRGTQEGYFYPDDLITRAEFVSAIVMAFDALDFSASTTFTDLNPADWYFQAIATAEHMRIIEGFPDNTFRGELYIPKDQLVVGAANTLVEQMGYFIPQDIEAALMRYLDRNQLAGWSEGGIALATNANIVIFRTDSLFAPQSIMTRGDAAIVLDRVFARVW